MVGLLAQAKIGHIAHDHAGLGRGLNINSIGTSAQTGDGAALRQLAHYASGYIGRDHHQGIAVRGSTQNIGLSPAFHSHQFGPGFRERRILPRFDRVSLSIEPQHTPAHALTPDLVNSANQRLSHSEGNACLTKGWRAQAASSSSMPSPGLSGNT